MIGPWLRGRGCHGCYTVEGAGKGAVRLVGVVLACGLCAPAVLAAADDDASGTLDPRLNDPEFVREALAERALLPELKGIRFLPDESAVSQEPVVLDAPVDVRAIPELANRDFIGQVAGFIGQPLTEPDLMVLRNTARMYLSLNGHPFSTVYLPPQDITNGYLQIVVATSVADQEVAVEGSQYFSPDEYRKWIRQAPGEPLDVAALRADIAWINRNPFRSVQPRMRRGSQPGTTQIMLAANERAPWKAFAMLSNTGSESTDRERWVTGVNWGNAFGLGHEASVSWSAGVEVARSKSMSLDYLIPLPWRHLLRIYGAWSESSTNPTDLLDQSGDGRQVGLDYEVPLSAGPRHQHALTMGLDYKRNDNLLLLLLGVDDIPLIDGSTEVYQLDLGYNLNIEHTDGSTTGLSLSAIYSPGGLSNRNNDDAFAGSRAGAKARYTYFTASAQYRMPFGQGLWNWSLRGNGQWTDDSLIGSEQLVAGGMYTVRGYDESIAFGDRGVIVGQELAFPPLFPVGLGTDQLRFFAFHEGGRVSNTNKLPDEQAVDLHSVGAGLRYQYREFVSANLAVGVPLRDAKRFESANPRLHFSLQISF